MRLTVRCRSYVSFISSIQTWEYRLYMHQITEKKLICKVVKKIYLSLFFCTNCMFPWPYAALATCICMHTRASKSDAVVVVEQVAWARYSTVETLITLCRNLIIIISECILNLCQSCKYNIFSKTENLSQSQPLLRWHSLSLTKCNYHLPKANSLM